MSRFLYRLLGLALLGTSSFGYVTAARPPRQMHLGLKFYY
jgi:hypothetical protein